MKKELESVVDVTNVHKRFRVYKDRSFSLKEFVIHRGNHSEEHEILKEIGFSVQVGETVALIGTNGSGKSTLLKLITGIIYPDSGTIRVNGKLTSLLELGAGFHPDFTGRENIYFNASIFGLNRKQIDKRIDNIIEFSELKEFIDSPVRTYSSGMYMRLAFSIAINVDADILLIDEILAVGDQHFQEKCMSKIKELINSGKTIIMVTHDMRAVTSICSRAIWLYQGRIMLDGDPNDVVAQYLKECR
jgi:ABC-type polysaccharide/polyol phosphate transport system ATPase subunit